jgi:hypothetical protein
VSALRKRHRSGQDIVRLLAGLKALRPYLFMIGNDLEQTCDLAPHPRALRLSAPSPDRHRSAVARRQNGWTGHLPTASFCRAGFECPDLYWKQWHIWARCADEVLICIWLAVQIDIVVATPPVTSLNEP